MSLPVVPGPYEPTLPSRATRAITERQGQLILPPPGTGAPRRLAVRVAGNAAWAAVVRALQTTVVGTEHVISFFVHDQHGILRSIGLPGVAPFTGPIFFAPSMQAGLALDAVLLHQRGLVRWHGRALPPKAAAVAIGRYADRRQKWYLPVSQRFARKLVPMWLQPDVGSTLQDVLSALTAFQRAGLTGTRVELK
jgi:hypothetical protein